MGKGIRSILHKLARCLKWLVVVVILLFMADLVLGHFIAKTNQRRVREFMTRIGARNFSELAEKASVDEPFSNDAWSRFWRTTASHYIEDVDLRERMLEEGHELIRKAMEAPFPMINFRGYDPFALNSFHLAPLGPYVDLCIDSAREHAAKGDPAVAVERLLDALAMSSGMCNPPILITHMLTLRFCMQIADATTDLLPNLPLPLLEELGDAVNRLDLEKRYNFSLAGEVFFGLEAWSRMGSDPVAPSENAFPSRGYTALHLPLGRSLLELDKSVYLDFMLPAVFDPNDELVKRLSHKEIPFYALITAMSCPSLEVVVRKHNEVQRQWIELKLRIEEELKRREAEKSNHLVGK